MHLPLKTEHLAFSVAADLVPWTTKLRVFGRLPSSTKLRALTELCHLRNPKKMVAAAVVDPDVMGPNILYRLLLEHVPPSPSSPHISPQASSHVWRTPATYHNLFIICERLQRC